MEEEQDREQTVETPSVQETVGQQENRIPVIRPKIRQEMDHERR